MKTFPDKVRDTTKKMLNRLGQKFFILKHSSQFENIPLYDNTDIKTLGNPENPINTNIDDVCLANQDGMDRELSKNETVPTEFSVGERCTALHYEDSTGTWYNGKVEAIIGDGTWYMVTFTDYDYKSKVDHRDMIKEGENMSPLPWEFVDKHVNKTNSEDNDDITLRFIQNLCLCNQKVS